MHSRDVIRQIEADGWVFRRSEGSHHLFQHPTKRGNVVVPHPKKDIPKGTLRNIERQAGLRFT